MLRAGNRGSAAEEERLRAVRFQIVKRTQDYDQTMYREVTQAEGRLGQVCHNLHAPSAWQPTVSHGQMHSSADASRAEPLSSHMERACRCLGSTRRA